MNASGKNRGAVQKSSSLSVALVEHVRMDMRMREEEYMYMHK